MLVPVRVQSEVEANMEVDLASLVSSSNLPLRKGESERERFYLTTAINYTNGEMEHYWGAIVLSIKTVPVTEPACKY